MHSVIRRLPIVAACALPLAGCAAGSSQAADETPAPQPAPVIVDARPFAVPEIVRDAAEDSAAVVATVERYHAALTAGDSAAALALLAPDAVVLESGGMETREEYRGHHLPADIEFARAIHSERGPIRMTVRGDAAWAWSTSTTRGEFRGRKIDSRGAELMVLTRSDDGWRIAAIHWSSRSAPPAS